MSRASAKPKAGLLLTPGAGAGRDQPALVAIDDAVSPDGIAVDRLDFPYRLAGRRAPDRAPVLVAAVREAMAALATRTGLAPSQLFAGGRSMGGRMCSMAVAEGTPCAGLVLVSYPLHPPGKPEKMRTDHFPAITVPCLFVSGERDPFGRPDELEAAVKAIPSAVTIEWLAGDHSLRRKDEEVAAVVRAWIAARLSA